MKDSRKTFRHKGVEVSPRNIMEMGQNYGMTSDYQSLKDDNGILRSYSRWWQVHIDDNQKINHPFVATKKQAIEIIDRILGT